MTPRRLILLVAACLLATVVRAQAPAEGYEARFASLCHTYIRDPHSVEAVYNLAQFYFDNSHPMRNLPLAKRYAELAEEEHVDLLQRNRVSDLVKLERKGITLTTIRSLRKAIADAAVESVRLRNDLSRVEIDTYLEAFGDNADLAKLLRSRRYQLIAKEVLASGTADECHDFLVTYAGTKEAESADERLGRLAAPLVDRAETEAAVDSLMARWPQSASVQRLAAKRKGRIAFQLADRVGSIEAYNNFLARYPASDESELARERTDQLLETELARRHTAMELAHFADSNADLDIADRALARLRRLIYATRDAEAAQYYVDHFKLDAYFSEVYSRYYSWHSVEGNGAPLERFARSNPDFPYPRALDDDLEKSVEIDAIPLMGAFKETDYDRYAGYVRNLMGKAIAVVPLQRMLQPLVAAQRYDDALFRLEQFEICFDNQWQGQYDELRRLLTTANAGRQLRSELPEGVTVQQLAHNAADGYLYYSDGRRIYRAVRRADGWQPFDTVHFDGTDAPLNLFGFSADGARMLLGSGGDIWIAEREGDRWRVSDIPPYPVNTDYVETDACLLPDGSGMLLASDRPGGQNLQPSGAYFHGDTALATDLWFIPYTNHRWGTPVNLGVKVNTLDSERCPVISRNLHTLYFVSDGHVGLGYGDVYVVERDDMSDWTSWGEPQNLGREVNSGSREGGLSLSPDERRLYLSSAVAGRPAAYSCATSHDIVAADRTYDLNVSDLAASLLRVQVVDVDQQAVTQVVDYMGDAPRIGITMRRGGRYALLADAGTNFVTATVVDPDLMAVYRLPAYTFEQLVAMDRPLPLPVVDFSADGSELLPVAQMQLEQLARFLGAHSGAVVEFVVDVAGSDARHSYSLAFQRCGVLRDFMVQRGIAADRILLSPYGNARVRLGGKSAVSARFRE